MHAPLDPERIAEATARRLLERATMLEKDGPTLAELRHAATEAGISPAAFDAAVAEWRAEHHSTAQAPSSRYSIDAVVRNVAAIAVGWFTVGLLAIPQRFVDAPWLLHKLTDPIGLVIGAVIAARLRARTASVILGGFAIAQGAEFLMDLFSGAPAVRGFGAHMALIIAGVAGVAIGRSLWRRSNGPDVRADPTTDADGATAPQRSSDSPADRLVRMSPARWIRAYVAAICVLSALAGVRSAAAQPAGRGCAPTDTACIAELRRTAMLRADSAAARTDTIIVPKPVLTLSVGDSMPMRSMPRPTGFDVNGDSVPLFAPMYSFARGDATARIRNGHIVGLSIGETTLFVRASRSGTPVDVTDDRPLTLIRIVVRP